MPGKMSRCCLKIWIRSGWNCNFAESRHFEALRGKIVPCALNIWIAVWLWLNFAVNLDGVTTAHRLSADMRFKFTRDFQLHHNNRPQQRSRGYVHLENYCWAMLGKVCANVGNARKSEIFSFWWLVSLLKSSWSAWPNAAIDILCAAKGSENLEIEDRMLYICRALRLMKSSLRSRYCLQERQKHDSRR